MDPVAHVDPAIDLVGALAVPGQIFAQVTVGLGGIDPEALEHVDAHLLLPGVDRMRLEAGDQLVRLDLAALGADVDVPGLVVDAGADIIELAVVDAEHLRDLVRTMLHAMAEAHHIDPAIHFGRPGIHRHGVGIVEEQGARLSYFPDILAEIKDYRNVALAIEDAAGADRIAHALVDAIFERDGNIARKGLEPAHPHTAHDVARPGDGRAPVGCRSDPGRQLVDRHNGLDDLPDHVQVIGVDIGQRKLAADEFGHLEQVGNQGLGEADGAGPDDGNFE